MGRRVAVLGKCPVLPTIRLLARLSQLDPYFHYFEGGGSERSQCFEGITRQTDLW
jgi:hypothetical protein